MYRHIQVASRAAVYKTQAEMQLDCTPYERTPHDDDLFGANRLYLKQTGQTVRRSFYKYNILITVNCFLNIIKHVHSLA